MRARTLAFILMGVLLVMLLLNSDKQLSSVLAPIPATEVPVVYRGEELVGVPLDNDKVTFVENRQMVSSSGDGGSAQWLKDVVLRPTEIRHKEARRSERAVQHQKADPLAAVPVPKLPAGTTVRTGVTSAALEADLSEFSQAGVGEGLSDDTQRVKRIEAKYKPKKLSGLEWVTSTKPLASWVKKKQELQDKWEMPGAPSVKMACLYAGFVRDFENMFASCLEQKSRKFCNFPKRSKMFGFQREYLLDSSGCDVYVSTWNIRGGGRFSTTNYKMSEMVSPGTLKKVYKGRLAGLHMQDYAAYQDLWKSMARFPRPFPQTRPKGTYSFDKATRDVSWSGVPELNYFIRQNDYSQSYKQWCVVQLALLSGFDYDLFVRLRFDLRMSHRLFSFRLAKNAGEPIIAFDIERKRIGGAVIKSAPAAALKGGQQPPQQEGDDDADQQASEGNATTTAMSDSTDDSDSSHVDAAAATAANRVTAAPGLVARHYVSATRIHSSNFDIADFGFMGPPKMIEHLASLWYYCLQPPSPHSPLPLINTFKGDGTLLISEYNYMIWRLIFDNKWKVDSGGRYLWISRRHGQKPPGGKGGGGGGTKINIKVVRVRKRKQH